MKFTRFFIPLVILLFILISHHIIKKLDTASETAFTNGLSCQGHPKDLSVKLTSHVYLLKHALPQDEGVKQRIFYGAAYYQNLYTFNNLQGRVPDSVIKKSSLQELDPKIEILSAEPAPYPHNAEFEKHTEINGFPTDIKDYVKRLSGRPISKGMESLKVTYRYENRLYLCLKKSLSLKELNELAFYQPKDPYAAYFVVPLRERRPMKNETRKALDRVNPCLDTKGIPPQGFSPFGLWYFWEPFSQGTDAEDRPFDCRAYFNEASSINKLHVTFTEAPKTKVAPLDFERFRNLERPLELIVFFGANESYQFPKFEAGEVKAYVARYLSGINELTARNELPFANGKYDGGFSILLWFLRNVGQHLDLRSTTTDVSDYLVKVTLKGKFKVSRRDVSLKLVLSPNHPKFSGMDGFSRTFASEFLRNDIVMYQGHVNSGSIFEESFTKLKDELLAAQNKNIPYQIFAIHSCSANYFFNPARFPVISHPHFRRDVIRTVGNFVDGSANSSLSLIARLDNYLYNRSQIPFHEWSKAARSDNFYLLRNF